MASEDITFTNDTINLSLGLSSTTTVTLNGTLTVDYSTGTVHGTLTDSNGNTYSGFTFSSANNTYTLASSGGVLTYGLTITYPTTTMAPSAVTTTSRNLLNLTTAQTTNVRVTSSIPCFATGTLIQVVRHGVTTSVAVENLAVGDHVVTSTGAARPIRWIGHRTVRCTGDLRPRALWPVRIATGAFGESTPSADLYLSPGHSVCVGVVSEVLIPVQELVNGSTVAYAETDAVTYWHIELETHDIIVANNLPVETFLEMGANRACVGEAANANVPIDVLNRTHADFCRPFVDDGTVLAAVREQLATRAVQRKRRPQATSLAAMASR